MLLMNPFVYTRWQKHRIQLNDGYGCHCLGDHRGAADAMVMVGRRSRSAVGGQKKERDDYLEKLFLGLMVCLAGDSFITKTAGSPFRINSLTLACPSRFERLLKIRWQDDLHALSCSSRIERLLAITSLPPWPWGQTIHGTQDLGSGSSQPCPSSGSGNNE